MVPGCLVRWLLQASGRRFLYSHVPHGVGALLAQDWWWEGVIEEPWGHEAGPSGSLLAQELHRSLCAPHSVWAQTE